MKPNTPMILPTHLLEDTSDHDVPWERAVAKQHQTHHVVQSRAQFITSDLNSTVSPRRVWRIALRLATQSPHSTLKSGVRSSCARKSLILSRELKAHTA